MDTEHLAVLAIVAFAASEIIGLNPQLKSNSVLQLVVRVALELLGPYRPKPPR